MQRLSLIVFFPVRCRTLGCQTVCHETERFSSLGSGALALVFPPLLHAKTSADRLSLAIVLDAVICAFGVIGKPKYCFFNAYA